MIIWMTGFSGSGKTTIAEYVRDKYKFILLDADEIRAELNSDLGFSYKEREEHGRRLIALARLIAKQDFDVIIPTITGDNIGRSWVRNELKDYDFKLIWVDADINECIRRDPKGIYKKNPEYLVGISSYWEDPDIYDLKIDTVKNSINQSFELIDRFINRG